MKEVLFRKEYSHYQTYLHKDSNEIQNHSEWNCSEKYPLFISDKSFITEEEFVKNFANPLANVYRVKHLIVVEKEENKLSLKFFVNQKLRKVGKSWFKTNKDVYYVTVNTKTGDVYNGSLLGYQKKKKFVRHIQKNFFLNNPLSSFRIKIKNYLSNTDPMNLLDTFEAIRIFVCNLDGNFDITNSDFNKRLFKFYLERKGIKFPNNFELFAPYLFGGKIRKKLKRNGFKLVDTFMDVHELRGEKLKQAIHGCRDVINLPVLNLANSLFPYEWLGSEENLLVKILDYNKGFSRDMNFVNDLKSLITKGELKNIFQIFKEVITNNIDNHTFVDHLMMYHSLKNYGEENLKWKSKTKKDFNTEHLDWTEKLDYYKRGSYKRIYPQFMEELISKVIKVDGNDYYPILLKTSEDYNSESYYQNNCVKTYMGRPASIIISLRDGSPDSEERATIEYQTFLFNTKFVKLRRVQTRGRFNTDVIGMVEQLNILDKRMDDIVIDDRFETVKIEKTCSNGVVLKSDSDWEDGYLGWTYNMPVDNLYNNNILNFI
jgi:hypothetical protein